MKKLVYVPDYIDLADALSRIENPEALLAALKDETITAKGYKSNDLERGDAGFNEATDKDGNPLRVIEEINPLCWEHGKFDDKNMTLFYPIYTKHGLQGYYIYENIKIQKSKFDEMLLNQRESNRDLDTLIEKFCEKHKESSPLKLKAWDVWLAFYNFIEMEKAKHKEHYEKSTIHESIYDPALEIQFYHPRDQGKASLTWATQSGSVKSLTFSSFKNKLSKLNKRK